MGDHTMGGAPGNSKRNINAQSVHPNPRIEMVKFEVEGKTASENQSAAVPKKTVHYKDGNCLASASFFPVIKICLPGLLFT